MRVGLSQPGCWRVSVLRAGNPDRAKSASCRYGGLRSGGRGGLRCGSSSGLLPRLLLGLLAGFLLGLLLGFERDRRIPRAAQAGDLLVDGGRSSLTSSATSGSIVDVPRKVPDAELEPVGRLGACRRVTDVVGALTVRPDAATSDETAAAAATEASAAATTSRASAVTASGATSATADRHGGRGVRRKREGRATSPMPRRRDRARLRESHCRQPGGDAARDDRGAATSTNIDVSQLFK